MNHLFVEVSIGDDCTWSATVVHPAFGESSQAFLNQLEAKWIEQTLARDEAREELRKHEDRLHSLLGVVAKANSLDKKTKPKNGAFTKPKQNNLATDEVLAQIQSAHDSCTELHQKISALQEIQLGGCCLDLEDLNAGGEFFAPRVYDLEQYFAKALERFTLEQNSATK